MPCPAFSHHVSRILRLVPWLVTAVLCAISLPAFAGTLDDQLFETMEEAGKTGEAILYNKDASFQLVPIPVSNPTIGTGLALSGIYLHAQEEEKADAPSTTTGLVGLYTSTQSWGFGAFHDGYYLQDRIRVRAGLGYGLFNLKYFGIGENSFFRDQPRDYTAQGIVFAPRALVKTPIANTYFGLQYYFMSFKNTFDLATLHPLLPRFTYTTQTGGLGLVAVYDARNSNLWPTRGSWIEASANKFGDRFGGNFEYYKYVGKLAHYFPLAETLTLAARADGKFIDGRAPSYDLPQIKIRGFPGGKYAARNAVSAQAEARWNFLNRWNLLLFGGGGRIADDISDLSSNPTHWAGGSGFRYALSREHGLNAGIDVAYGDGRVEIYFQVGDSLAN